MLLAVEELTPEQRQRISEICWEVGLKRDDVITPVVSTRTQLEHGAMGTNPFMSTIRREGFNCDPWTA